MATGPCPIVARPSVGPEAYREEEDDAVLDLLGGSLSVSSSTGWLDTTLAVAVAVAAGLLVPAGVAKLRTPAVARRALGAPARVGDGAVRVLGAGELVLAAGVLVIGGPVLVGLLAVTYLGFALVAARQRSRGEGCGCFGVETETPTSLGHVVLDGVAAAAAAVAVVVSAPSLLAVVVADGSALAVPFLLGVVVAVASAQLLLTALPDLAAAARRGAGGSP